MSYCELCGSQITGRAIPIVVENDVVMKVCGPCSKHGRQRPKRRKSSGRGERKRVKQQTVDNMFTFKFPSVRDDYSRLIKAAREKHGLSEDELGEKMGAAGPVVKLLELGKFKPDEALARKLEELLGVSLLVKEGA